MFPKRGALAAFLTWLMLVGLLYFKAPAPPAMADPALQADPPADSSAGVAIADASSPASSNDASATGSAAGTAGGGKSPTPGSSRAASPAPSRSGTTGATPKPTSVTVGTPQPATPPPPPPPPAATPTPKPLFTGTLDGSVVQTQYGPMQVRVVYTSGRITDVITLQSTNSSSQSVSISARACPILRSEALAAQSAKINTVSGATYTSSGYKTSLQAAIAKKPY